MPLACFPLYVAPCEEESYKEVKSDLTYTDPKEKTTHFLLSYHSSSLSWDIRRAVSALKDPWSLCLRELPVLQGFRLSSSSSTVLSFISIETGQLNSPSFPASAPARGLRFSCSSCGNVGSWGFQHYVQVRVLHFELELLMSVSAVLR